MNMIGRSSGGLQHEPAAMAVMKHLQGQEQLERHINLGELRLTEMTFSEEPAVKGDGLRGESTRIIEKYLKPGEENYQS